MSKAILGFQIGKAVCEALGLDPKSTRSIDIHIASDKCVTATVEHFIGGEEADSLISVLSAYTLEHERDISSTDVKEGDDITPLGDTFKRTA